MARNLPDTAKHLIKLLRLGGASSRRLADMLETGTDKMVAEITKALRGGAAQPEVLKLVNESVNEMKARSVVLFNEDAFGVMQFAYASSNTYLGVLAADVQIRSLAVTKKMVSEALKMPLASQKISVNDLIDATFAGYKARVAGIVREAYITGVTNRGIARSFIDNYITQGDLLMRHVDAVARTSVMQVANTARLKSFVDNSDLVNRVIYVATLDHRTTRTCMLLDGKVWAIDDPKKQTPPVHVNCRSSLAPILKGESLEDVKAQLNRPYVIPKSKEEFDRLGLKTRGGKVRKPSATDRSPLKGVAGRSYRTYEEWLRAQPVYYQDAILGKKAARKFRATNLRTALSQI